MGIAFEGFGNILTHQSQTITIPVNTVGVMGAGLALSARNRILGLNEFYKEACNNAAIAIGRSVIYKIPDRHKQVLLFPTKGHWKDDSKLEDIEEALTHLANNFERMGIKELAVPALGCGLGKLDYIKEVRPLLVKYLGALDIPVHILLRDQWD